MKKNNCNFIGYKLMKKSLLTLADAFARENNYNRAHFFNEWDNNGLCEQVERQYRQQADIIYGKFVDRGLPVNIADALYERFAI